MQLKRGIKKRIKQSNRVSFVMRLDPLQHQQLKQLAEHQQVTMAFLLERCLHRALLSEMTLLEREPTKSSESSKLVQLCSQTQAEVKDLIGQDWLQLSVKRQRGLVYLAMFPYEPPWGLARMCGISRQWMTQVKRSTIGLKVLNYFSSWSLWSRRPEILQAVIDKATESDEPAWSELALRIFGDYGVWVEKEQIRLGQQTINSNRPADLDRQLIKQAKLINMTPARFEKLWQRAQLEVR